MESLSKITGSQLTEPELSALNPIEQKVALATVTSASNPRLRDFNSAQAAKAADSIMVKASVMLGQKKKVGEEYELITKALIDSFVKFPNLKVKEIFSATDNGLEGLYRRREDEPIIFNPSNWIQWVRAYIEETKKPVMKKTSQVYRKQELEPDPPSEYESMTGRFKILTNAIVGQFESGTSYQDYGGIVYDFLCKMDLLIPIQEGSPELHQAALWLLNNARDSKDKSKIKSAKETLFRISEGFFDESVLSVAIRKRVASKLKEVCESGEDDIISFLEIARERLESYFLENSIEKE